MPLERKPVEEAQDPGYPSTAEYTTGRRAFIGLLGLTALGIGGAYALNRPSSSRPQPFRMLGDTVVAVPPAQPGGSMPVPAQPEAPVDGGLTPVQPQAEIRGEAEAPESPTDPEATGPMDAPVLQQPVAQPIPVPPPTQPQAAMLGRVRVVQPPAQPQAVADGKPVAPAAPKP